MPKLSIITINFNNATGLKKTIESVVSQSSQDFEYIVIDGGSSDGSIEIIKAFATKIRYWISEPDKGIYHAMNKGIKVAKGEYCQFLNSGDWLLSKDVTEKMLFNFPQCSIVYANKIREYNGIQKIEKSYQGRQITLLDLYNSTIFHASAYIKRSLFDKYGLYDETLKIVSDWKFYLITVGLNDESVAYKDIDLVWFDSTGISSINKELDKIERTLVLQNILPSSIRLDYNTFAIDGQIIKRLKKNKLIWFFMISIYRIFFRIDKFSNKYEKTYSRLFR